VPSWGDAVASVETQTQELKLKFLRAGGANNDKQEPTPFTLAEVDDFVSFARNVGAEPLLQVPLIKGIAGAAATAQDAADLVTYVNVTKSYGIKYFAIGNEPDLYEEQSLRDAGYDAVAFCTEYRAFATAMRAVDPGIKLVGPDLSWKYVAENDWLTPFLENCGDVVDVVAVHRYPLQPTVCTQAKAYSDVVAYRRVLTRVRKVMESTGQAEKPLAFTEANITWDGDPAKSTMEASPGTFSAALWLADNLGASLEGQLDNVSYWSLSEGWTLGFFDGTKPRPAFHVLKLFSTQFGSEVLTVTGASTDLSVYSGYDADAARTSLFLINKTSSPLELSVSFVELPRTEALSLVVAPHSLQLAIVPDDGSTPTVTNYASDMASPTVATP
ncbi:MAG TPA: glycosyl hydrolase, partial [Polyangiaceae bacterium]|nr:glycosyl hydrolase [Polyangiaceae bacterium]